MCFQVVKCVNTFKKNLDMVSDADISGYTGCIMDRDPSLGIMNKLILKFERKSLQHVPPIWRRVY